MAFYVPGPEQLQGDAFILINLEVIGLGEA
jgi:hypothetical protein